MKRSTILIKNFIGIFIYLFLLIIFDKIYTRVEKEILYLKYLD